MERRPKKGDEDYIKRPENAFILFRRKCCEDRQAADEAAEEPVKKQRQADLSKAISQQWKSLPADERAYWEDLAKEKKKEHEAMYPNYVYRPQRTKERAKSKKGKGRNGGEQETDVESSISFVLPVPSQPRSLSRDSFPALTRGQNRRAVSAPTPPPAHQIIQLPSVFMPSCPTSPSLLPRISRRSPRIPHPDDDHLTHFEYLPNDSLYPPTFQQPATFEPNMQVRSRSRRRSDKHQLIDRSQTDQLFHMFQAEQSALQQQQQQSHPQSQGGPLLQSLRIPRDPALMSSSLVSPAESIASSQFLSPIDHYTSPISPSSSHGAPYTPAEAISMMALSLGGQTDDMSQQQPSTVAPGQASEFAFSSFSWSTDGSFWPDENMIPDDFDLSAIPPIELGISKFDGEMQQIAGMTGGDVPLGYDFTESGEFPPMDMAPEHDLHDADPGQDPFNVNVNGMFSGYDNGNMPW